MELRYLLDLHPALIKNSLRWQSIKQVFRKCLFLFYIAQQACYLVFFIIVSQDLITSCLASLKVNCHLIPLSYVCDLHLFKQFCLLLLLFSISVSTIIALEAYTNNVKVKPYKYKNSFPITYCQLRMHIIKTGTEELLFFFFILQSSCNASGNTSLY